MLGFRGKVFFLVYSFWSRVLSMLVKYRPLCLYVLAYAIKVFIWL